MPEHIFSTNKVTRGFSWSIFAITVVLSLAGLLSAFYLTAPNQIWARETSANWKQFTLALLATSLVNCFVEYFFHRYVLHGKAIPFLKSFYEAHHCRHHPLTRIAKKRTSNGKEVLFLVDNLYPIIEPKQKEASIFPWYSFAAFAALATPFLALVEWLIPPLPWFFAGYSAIALSLTLYEGFHFIEHWPLERWLPLIEHPRWGKFWTKVYGFHLRHHAVTDCNEAISGFFLLPLADIVFGTCVIPKTLYVTGEEWHPAKFEKPRPYFFIRWCDELAQNLTKRRRAQTSRYHT